MATKVRVTKTTIEDPKKKTMVKVATAPAKGLTYDQINRWSDYAEAHPGGKFDDLFAGFSSAHKNHGIDPNVLKSELDKLKINSMRQGREAGSDFGENIHTGYAFPKLVIDGKNMGRVNADLKTEVAEASPAFSGTNLEKTLPSGTEEAWWDDKLNVVGFKDPHTGDIRYADKINLNHPLVKASMQKQKDDYAARQAALAVNTTPIK